MEVIAIKMGIWNASRVRPGTKFEVPDGTRANWFVPAGAAKAPKPAKPKDQTPVALSQLGQRPVQTMNQVLGQQKDSDLA